MTRAAVTSTRPPAPRSLPRPRRGRSTRSRTASMEARPGWRSRHAFLFCLLLLAQALFFTSSLFQVQRIHVVGMETVSARDVLRKSQLRKGDSLWSAWPGEVANRVAEIRNVHTCQVEYCLPGEVTITVTERRPAYQVSSASSPSQWFAVDAQGLVLRRLKGCSNEWPRLRLELPVQPGTRLHPALIATCEQACRKIESRFPGAIWYYRLDSRGNLGFRTFSQQRPVDVQLGNLDSLDYKLQILDALQAGVLKKKEVAAIDLRFSTPVVQLLNPPKPPAEEPR